jgi:hypothetical protein
MEQDWVFYFQIISTFSVLLPIGIGLMHLRGIDDIFKAFVGFLVVGFVVDLAGGVFALTDFLNGNYVVKYVYNIFEPLFLCWILQKITSVGTLKNLLKKAWMIIIPLWLISVFFNDFFPIYKIITQIFIAFASCFCILEFVEKESDITHKLTFWALIGIFFYNFCTFFFMGFLNTSLGLDLWYLHNVINVLTNLIYFVGFYFTPNFRADRSEVKSPNY